MFYKGISHVLKNVTLHKEFFRNCRSSGSAIPSWGTMSQRCPPKRSVLSIKEVTKIPVSEHNKRYRHVENISWQIENILRATSKPDSFIPIQPEFMHDKLWICCIDIPYENDLQPFVGRGITKKTAEHNCKLAALLWLKDKMITSRSAPAQTPIECIIAENPRGFYIPQKMTVNACPPPPSLLLRQNRNKQGNKLIPVEPLDTPFELLIQDPKKTSHSFLKSSYNNTGNNTNKKRTDLKLPNLSSIQQRLWKFNTPFEEKADLGFLSQSDSLIADDTISKVVPLEEFNTPQTDKKIIVSEKRNTVNWRPVRWYLGLKYINPCEPNINITSENISQDVSRKPFKFDWDPVYKYLGLNCQPGLINEKKQNLVQTNINNSNEPTYAIYLQGSGPGKESLNMQPQNRTENNVQDLRTLLNQKYGDKIKKPKINGNHKTLVSDRLLNNQHFLSNTIQSTAQTNFSNYASKRLINTSATICLREPHETDAYKSLNTEDKPEQDLRILLNQKYDEKNAQISLTCNKNVNEIASSNQEIREIMFENTPEAIKLNKLFPEPKQILHNFYHMLTQQLKTKFEMTPQYKTVGNTKTNSMWLCTYRLHWPIECRISAKARTKKDASKFAALQALMFLQQENKLDKEGYPIIFTKEQIKDVKQDKIDLKLTKDCLSNMKEIIELFNRNILQNISNLKISSTGDNAVVFTQEDSLDLSVIHNQRYLSFDMYLAKEKLDLPIVRQKQQFMELFKTNRVIIVKGEPGCGKSTRIPQYVLESWAHEALPSKPCRIVVTQPRKIAAISLAERVSNERMESLGSIVGYQVRLDSKFQPRTGRILYCTTGILLRHFQADPLLRKFTCVILDEAHERDVNADLLMNLLRKALKENDNLKVIVMSATIETDLFQRYFSDGAVLDVPGMTYPVDRYFLDNDTELNVGKTVKMSESQHPSVVHEDVVEVIKYIHRNKPEGAILVFLPGWNDIAKVQKLIPRKNDLVVLPLHSKLQHSEQTKIFSKPPPGIRKIILATNIAETSITIDDIVYVIDTGIFKNQVYDVEKSVNIMDDKWISKASVSQRSGRAGRCRPGESYHMYTRARFDSFADYNVPQILETSLTKIVLDSKTFSNNKNAVEWMNELPTPPEKSAVQQAVNSLKDLELLDKDENLTPLGRILVNFQLEPKLAKTMVNSVIYKCTTPIVDIVTLFSAEVNIFESILSDKESIKDCKARFCSTSDHLAMLRIFEKWLEIYEEGDARTEARFTSSYKLVPHRLRYVEKLRTIHFDYLRNGLYESVSLGDDFSDSDEIVKGVLFGGVGNLLHMKNWEIVKNRLKHKNVLMTKNNHKAQITQESVNCKKKKTFKFLTYINETLSNVRKTTLIRETSVIPNMSVILFSNNGIVISETNIAKEETSDKVNLELKNIGCFVCDRSDAQILVRCKESLRECYKYYVYQLTSSGDSIPQIDQAWIQILTKLDKILKAYKCE